jgi:ABC-type nitrate/sulfonate/bicarbonate transport system substrate-binding protein
MLLRLLLVLFGFLCASPGTVRSADRVKLALPAKSMGYLPLFIAAHGGFFKDETIDI